MKVPPIRDCLISSLMQMIQADITSLESVENLFEQVDRFYARISTAGPSYVGPWKSMTDNGIRINAVSPTVIEDSPLYFPGEMPVSMRKVEYGFRKSVFSANTGQVITPR